jgi:cell division protein FtsL
MKTPIRKQIQYGAEPVLLILLSIAFFYTAFSLVMSKIERREAIANERRELNEAYMLIQELRASGAAGINLNANPEL